LRKWDGVIDIDERDMRYSSVVPPWLPADAVGDGVCFIRLLWFIAHPCCNVDVSLYRVWLTHTLWLTLPHRANWKYSTRQLHA